MTLPANLDQLSADELRELVRQQAEVITRNDRELNWRKIKIDKLTHEVAYYKRHYFGIKAERLPVEQGQLFEETLAADMAAITEELAQLSETETKPKGQAKRKALPPELPRTEIHHEPDSTTCTCGCQMQHIGEDVAEKLDYTPGTFTVERHIRGKWACAHCETLVQAPVPAHVIDKGIPTTGLLAHVLIAKYLDHLPLYRQEGIFGRAGLPIPQSTLAEWVGQMGVTLQPLVDALKTEMLSYPVLHADETPVAMLDPGKGKTHRAYLWSYSIGAFEPIKAVIYDFADSRAGKHAQEFLGAWRGTLVCDDYAGYKALIADGVTEAGCMAQVPIDNNWIENRIRPIATGRKNWLFAGSLRAGKRAAAIMSLIQSAKLNGHDPFLYLQNILSRLPTQPNSRISELLPHRWLPEISA